MHQNIEFLDKHFFAQRLRVAYIQQGWVVPHLLMRTVEQAETEQAT